jgi:hypothetical protein
VDGAVVSGDVEALHRALDETQEESGLPEAAGRAGFDALHQLVVRARLNGGGALSSISPLA